GAGSRVKLEERPWYYGGVLNVYKLAFTLRANLHSTSLKEAEDKFLAARQKLLAEGGGVVSIVYHPCEFVHKQFWDGVNFRNGANPPPDKWKIPPAKSPEQTAAAYANFEAYVRFMKRFADVRFITASDAVRLYRDRARARHFTGADVRAVAEAVGDEVNFQRHGDYALAPAEVFELLTAYVAARAAGRTPDELTLGPTPYGPTGT